MLRASCTRSEPRAWCIDGVEWCFDAVEWYFEPMEWYVDPVSGDGARVDRVTAA